MKLFKFALATTLFGAATLANAGILTSNFSSNTGMAELGSASVIDGKGVLTPSSSDLRGGFLFNSIDEGKLLAQWSASFEFTISDNKGGGADGISFGLVREGDSLNLHGFLGEEGATAGLAIGFDTYNNGEISANHVSVRFDDNIITTVDLDNLFELQDGTTYTSLMTFNNGIFNLSLNDEAIVNDLSISGWQPYAGNFYFAARTGGASSLQVVDNLHIETTTVPAPATFALVLCGLAGLITRRHYKK
ncbi:hypothetical protein CA267_002620 [Alteromonas pelagimontana]|uniref:PEP-CTERM sorting domain-containing protein n=1 Tax=Alteromonas pelagimontana TaxID=1858656 RepID=A0A6M4MC82_9ALTE|nr:hypothetical protein [Alteromonas pelagimontana]QJR79766.1 hypothetical protein CA267_002620 [Alteromonas pelagimontana]